MIPPYITRELKKGNWIIFDRTEESSYLCEAESLTDLDLAELMVASVSEEEVEVQFDSRIPFGTLVLNTTEACNLRCTYCSRHHTDYINKSMHTSVMKKCLSSAAMHGSQINEKIVVQFHGGEPSLEWKNIEVALKAIRPSFQKFLDLRIQTNGTLVTDSFLSFCEQHDIHLGLSIDGPPGINGINRKFANGKSIDDRLHRNLNRIRDSKLRKHISCLCVVSSANVNRADEVFDYVIKMGIDDLSILPMYPDFSGCLTDACSIIPRTPEMVQFSVNIFERWINRLKEGFHISIPSFQIWIWNLLSTNAQHTVNNSCCGVGQSLLFVDTDGEIYPCGPFSYEKQMSMGNIQTCDLNSISSNQTHAKFARRTTLNIQECNSCALQGICRGGCPANSYLSKKSLTELDPFCAYWKGIISHIMGRICEDPTLIDIVPDFSIRM